MAIDYEVLRTEIQTDPLERGYVNMSATEIATSLYEVNRPLRQLVPLWKIKKHAIENGYWITLKNVAQDHPGYAVATLCVDYVSDARFENIDMDLNSTKTLLGGLVTVNLLTQDLANELDAMANTLQSRATELGLEGVSSGHVLMIVQ